MIPFHYKIIGAGAVCFFLFGSGFVTSCHYQGKKSAAREAVWQAKYDAQVAFVEKTEKDRKKLVKEIDENLKPKLAAATANGNDLAKRLREYAGRRAVSPSPGITPGDAVASGDGSRSCSLAPGTESALTAYFGAAERDAVRLNTFIEFYRALQEAQ